MGKQEGLYLHGREDNILYYSWKDIPCTRIIPEKVYQSQAMVAHKNANGLSTVMGASFRKLLTEIIPYPKSMQMQTAVRLALLKWLKSGSISIKPPAEIDFITGLYFNERAALRKCLHVPLSVTLTEKDKLSVLVPEMIPVNAFAAPSHTHNIRLKLSAACCNFKTGDAIASDNLHIDVAYNADSIPAQKILFSLEMPMDSLTIVAAAIEYFAGKNGVASLISNEQFRPAEIIGTWWM